MMLSEIKRYFTERRAASLGDLSLHFRVEPEAMRGILDQWIRKGKMCRLPQETSCKGCCKPSCSDHTEIYEWMG